jgi:EmrB/QacA subfamily drug resistance transporter
VSPRGGGPALPLSGRDRSRALAIVCAVLFLTFLDTTVVAVALANVQSDLHVGVSGLQWVVNGYALSFASLMLGAGALADRIGRRRMMLAGLVIFALGSALGAASPSVAVLIGARVIMGIGAAAAEPGTLSIIRQLYTDAAERARALGIWAAICGLALAIGPVVGGVLTGLWSWRLVFLVNLVAACLLALAVHHLVPETATREKAPIDLWGIGLISVTLVCGTLAVIDGESAGYANGGIVALFIACGLGAIGFIVTEHRASSPMLDPRAFRTPAYASALGVAFALFFGIFSIFFFTALYLESVIGFSAYRAAGEFGPMAITLVAASLVSGRLIARAGPRTPMVIGGVLAGGGIFWTASILSTAGNPSGLLVVALALCGVGFGLAFVPVTTVTLELVPAEHSSTAASTTNTSRELGAVVGVAVLGSLVNGHLTTDLAMRLHSLGVPSIFQAVVISAIERGEATASQSDQHLYGPIVDRVIDAAYAAFRSGLEEALVIAGVIILVATAAAALSLHSRARAGVEAERV